MSDARDLNRDGHVSLAEKVKDKLHLGHKNKDAGYTSTHTTTGARDLNHDGHISTAERLATGSHNSAALPLAGAGFAGAGTKDLNHDGHISTSERLATAGGARDLNHDGHISTGERLASGSHMPMAAGGLAAGGLAAGSHMGSSHMGSGFTDSRDLNRDGHVSTGERLAAGSHMGSGYAGSGFTDSRDLNRDGHISTAERLAAGTHMAGGMTEEARLRLHEEQLAISKREVGAGEVDIHKRVQQETVAQTIPVRREEVTVERVPLSGVAEPGAVIASQDEVVRVPLFREEIITEKRIVPTEEVIVRKTEVMDQQTVGATLRSEYVETTQTGMSTNIAGAAFDARDTNRDGHVSMGEKLKGGNAYNTGAFDARDTNRDGHVSMGEKLKGGNAYNNTGFGDSRDLNRDGHVSMGEKLATADRNGDGRVSTGEKIRAARG